MPDLPNRDQFEADVVAAIMPLFEEWRDKTLRAPSQVDAYIYGIELAKLIIQPLAETYFAAGLNVAIERRLPFNMVNLEIEAREWANTVATPIIERLATNITSSLSDLIRAPFPEGKTVQQANAELNTSIQLLFAQQRIERLAATEVTRAISIGEQQTVAKGVQLKKAFTGSSVPPPGGFDHVVADFNEDFRIELPYAVSAVPGEFQIRREGDWLILDGGLRRDGTRRLIRIPIDKNVAPRGGAAGTEGTSPLSPGAPPTRGQEQPPAALPEPEPEAEPEAHSPIWRIDPRSNVCPICLSLNGQTIEVYGIRFPQGPPAHPNCRCYLDYVSR